MVEELTGAIGRALEERWGEEYRIYTESVYQNAEKPCFFIECERTERKELLGGRFFVKADIKVTIENDSDTKKSDAEAMVTEIFDLFSFVDVNGLSARGRNMSGKWEKNSFVIQACFDLWCCNKTREDAMMEAIEVKGK